MLLRCRLLAIFSNYADVIFVPTGFTRVLQDLVVLYSYRITRCFLVISVELNLTTSRSRDMG